MKKYTVNWEDLAENTGSFTVTASSKDVAREKARQKLNPTVTIVITED